jgi:ADP-ribosylglycohydrolase
MAIEFYSTGDKHGEVSNSEKTAVAAGIVGLAVGDALGVPVEFEPRERLRRDPVTSMRSLWEEFA